MRFNYYLSATLITGLLTVGDLSLAYGAATTHIMENRVETYELPVVPGQPVVLSLSSPILEIDAPRRSVIQYSIKPGHDIVTLHIPKSARPDQLRSRFLVLARHYLLYINVIPQPKGVEAPDVLQVKHRDQVQLLNMAARTLAENIMRRERANHARRLAAERATYKAEVAKLNDRIEGLQGKLNAASLVFTERALLTEVLPDPDTPTYEVGECDARGVALCKFDVTKLRTRALLRFDINNRTVKAFPVSQIQVLNELESSDHAGEVHIAGRSPVRPNGAQDEEPMVTIPPLTQVSVAVVLRKPDQLGRSLKLVVKAPRGTVTAIKLVVPSSW